MQRIVIALALTAVIILFFLKWQEEQRKMSEVIPGLLISDWLASTDEQLLGTKGVTLIICLNQQMKTTEDEAVYHRLGIRHVHFKISDRPGAPIALLFNRTFQLIDDEISRGGRVLVHCRVGISRSVTVAAAYLIQKNNVSAGDAIKQIRRARRIAWPNYGFRSALEQLHGRREDPSCVRVF